MNVHLFIGNISHFSNSIKDQWEWFIGDQRDVLEGKRNHFHGSYKIYDIDIDEANKKLADWQHRQLHKKRSLCGQAKRPNYVSLTPKVDTFGYDLNPANRNWQYRSD